MKGRMRQKKKTWTKSCTRSSKRLRQTYFDKMESTGFVCQKVDLPQTRTSDKLKPAVPVNTSSNKGHLPKSMDSNTNSDGAWRIQRWRIQHCAHPAVAYPALCASSGGASSGGASSGGASSSGTLSGGASNGSASSRFNFSIQHWRI